MPALTSGTPGRLGLLVDAPTGAWLQLPENVEHTFAVREDDVLLVEPGPGSRPFEAVRFAVGLAERTRHRVVLTFNGRVLEVEPGALLGSACDQLFRLLDAPAAPPVNGVPSTIGGEVGDAVVVDTCLGAVFTETEPYVVESARGRWARVREGRFAGMLGRVLGVGRSTVAGVDDGVSLEFEAAEVGGPDLCTFERLDNVDLLEGPRCPKCDGGMVVRTRRRDRSPFLGCAQYPRCRGARTVAGRRGDYTTPESNVTERPRTAYTIAWLNRPENARFGYGTAPTDAGELAVTRVPPETTLRETCRYATGLARHTRQVVHLTFNDRTRRITPDTPVDVAVTYFRPSLPTPVGETP